MGRNLPPAGRRPLKQSGPVLPVLRRTRGVLKRAAEQQVRSPTWTIVVTARPLLLHSRCCAVVQNSHMPTRLRACHRLVAMIAHHLFYVSRCWASNQNTVTDALCSIYSSIPQAHCSIKHPQSKTLAQHVRMQFTTAILNTRFCKDSPRQPFVATSIPFGQHSLYIERPAQGVSMGITIRKQRQRNRQR